MKIKKGNVNRIGIFFFYDQQGVVDQYVLYLLKNMLYYCTKIIVVVNGKLTIDSRKNLEQLGCIEVLVRENEGFDVWAYKTALEYYGYDNLKQVDELIMFNYTIAGPIEAEYLEEMFSNQEKKDVDFWGLSLHHAAPFNPWEGINLDVVPIHLQSHFIVVRNKMLTSFEFKKYWDERPPILCYEEAVACHEAIFTKYFEEKGFCWNVYCDSLEDINKTIYPMFSIPQKMIEKYHSPFFKRKLFYYNLDEKMRENINQVAPSLYHYLKNKTSYDMDMFLNNIVRCNPLDQVVNGINLNTIFDETRNVSATKSYAVLIDSEYKGLDSNLVEECAKNATVYLFESDKKYKKADSSKVVLLKHKKQNWTSIYYSLNEIKEEYCLILANNEQKYIETRNDNGAFQYIIDNSIVSTPEYRNQIVNQFEAEPVLALTYMPNPMHSMFYNYETTIKNSCIKTINELNYQYGLDLNYNLYQGAIGQLSGCMWVRKNVMISLLEHIPETAWNNGVEHEIYVFTTLLSLLAQAEERYVNRSYNQTLAKTYIENYSEISAAVKRSGKCEKETLVDFCMDLDYKTDERKSYAYFDYGTGYKAIYKQKLTLKKEAQNDTIRVSIFVPKGVKEIRIQLAEGLYSIVTNARCLDASLQLHPIAGFLNDQQIIFNNHYPQFVLQGNFEDKREIVVEFDNVEFYYTRSDLSQFISTIKEAKSKVYESTVELRNYKNELENKNNMIKRQQEQIQNLQHENSLLEAFHQEVIHAKFFRLLHMFDKK